MKYLNYIKCITTPIFVLFGILYIPLYTYSQHKFAFEFKVAVTPSIIGMVFAACYLITSYMSFLIRKEIIKKISLIASIPLILLSVIFLASTKLYKIIQTTTLNLSLVDIFMLIFFIVLSIFESSVLLMNIVYDENIKSVCNCKANHNSNQIEDKAAEVTDEANDQINSEGVETEDPSTIKDKIVNLHSSLKKPNSLILSEIEKTGEFAGMVIDSHEENIDNNVQEMVQDKNTILESNDVSNNKESENQSIDEPVVEQPVNQLVEQPQVEQPVNQLVEQSQVKQPVEPVVETKNKESKKASSQKNNEQPQKEKNEPSSKKENNDKFTPQRKYKTKPSNINEKSNIKPNQDNIIRPRRIPKQKIDPYDFDVPNLIPLRNKSYDENQEHETIEVN